MKLSHFSKRIFLASAFFLIIPATSSAAEDEDFEKKCIAPKFRDFLPANKAEVSSKSAISFHVNRMADPLHIRASAKKIPLKVEVVDKNTFFYVTAKLPAELPEGFARIHVEAKGIDGDCIGEDGWLLKIKGNSAIATTP